MAVYVTGIKSIISSGNDSAGFDTPLNPKTVAGIQPVQGQPILENVRDLIEKFRHQKKKSKDAPPQNTQVAGQGQIAFHPQPDLPSRLSSGGLKEDGGRQSLSMLSAQKSAQTHGGRSGQHVSVALPAQVPFCGETVRRPTMPKADTLFRAAKGHDHYQDLPTAGARSANPIKTQAGHQDAGETTGRAANVRGDELRSARPAIPFQVKMKVADGTGVMLPAGGNSGGHAVALTSETTGGVAASQDKLSLQADVRPGAALVRKSDAPQDPNRQDTRSSRTEDAASITASVYLSADGRGVEKSSQNAVSRQSERHSLAGGASSERISSDYAGGDKPHYPMEQCNAAAVIPAAGLSGDTRDSRPETHAGRPKSEARREAIYAQPVHLTVAADQRGTREPDASERPLMRPARSRIQTTSPEAHPGSQIHYQFQRWTGERSVTIDVSQVGGMILRPSDTQLAQMLSAHMNHLTEHQSARIVPPADANQGESNTSEHSSREQDEEQG